MRLHGEHGALIVGEAVAAVRGCKKPKADKLASYGQAEQKMALFSSRQVGDLIFGPLRRLDRLRPAYCHVDRLPAAGTLA